MTNAAETTATRYTSPDPANVLDRDFASLTEYPEMLIDPRNEPARISFYTTRRKFCTTMDAFHGLVLEFPISRRASVHDIAADLANAGSPIARLVNRIIRGHDTDWNGSNMVGTLTSDARKASDLLLEWLGEDGVGIHVAESVWSEEDPFDWLHPAKEDLRIEVLGSTDAEIDAVAARLVAEALDEEVVLDLGLTVRFLTEIRDEAEAEIAV